MNDPTLQGQEEEDDQPFGVQTRTVIMGPPDHSLEFQIPLRGMQELRTASGKSPWGDQQPKP